MIQYTGTKWQQIKKAKMCYLFVLPFLLLFLTFVVIPVLVAFVFAFTDFINLISRRSPGNLKTVIF